MPIIKFFRKLSGLVRGGNVIESPPSHNSSRKSAEKLESKLPQSNIVRKKKDWRFSKDEY